MRNPVGRVFECLPGEISLSYLTHHGIKENTIKNTFNVKKDAQDKFSRCQDVLHRTIEL